jgi:hypothetical protein
VKYRGISGANVVIAAVKVAEKTSDNPLSLKVSATKVLQTPHFLQKYLVKLELSKSVK